MTSTPLLYFLSLHFLLAEDDFVLQIGILHQEGVDFLMHFLRSNLEVEVLLIIGFLHPQNFFISYP